jgi:hypothetical protein
MRKVYGAGFSVALDIVEALENLHEMLWLPRGVAGLGVAGLEDRRPPGAAAHDREHDGRSRNDGRSDDRVTTLDDTDQQYGDGKHEQQVDESTERVRAHHPQQPQDH